MTAGEDTTDWKPRWLRRPLQAVLWAATAALLGWLLGLQPTWQLLVLVLACTFVGFARAESADGITRWVERAVRMVIWAVVFFTLCWLLNLQPTWELLLLALACTLADLVIERWLPPSAPA